jgi:rubrerythrin
MSDETKKVKKEELTDEQVEKATGGYTMSCPKCRKTISYTTIKPKVCPYCKAALTLRA